MSFLSRVSRTSLLLPATYLCSLILCAQNTTVSARPAPRRLDSRGHVERDLKGRLADNYEIQLLAGSFLKVMLFAKGAGVDAAVFAPDYSLFRTLVNPDDDWDDERIELDFIAERSGLYFLHFGARKGAPTHYVLDVNEIRSATSTDRTAAATNELVSTAAQLRTRKSDRNSLLQATQLYRQALPLIQNEEGKRQAFRGLAATWRDLENYEQALECLSELVKLDIDLGDLRGQAFALETVGQIRLHLGQTFAARQILEKALAMSRLVHSSKVEIDTLDDLGNTADLLGEFQDELNYYKAALAKVRAGEPSDCDCEYSLLLNIGVSYIDLHENEIAITYINEALKKASAPSLKSACFNNLGKAYSALGDRERAWQYFHDALAISTKANYRSGEAAQRSNLGVLYQEQGDQKAAAQEFQHALQIYRSLQKVEGEIKVLNALGRAQMKEGLFPEARGGYEQALQLAQDSGNRVGQALALEGLAHIERQQGHLSSARHNSEAAIQVMEGLRSGIANEISRASFFSGVRDFYDFEIDLLMDLHRINPSARFDKTALDYSDHSRARAFLDELSRTTSREPLALAPELVSRQQELRDALNASISRQLQATVRKHPRAEIDRLSHETEEALSAVNDFEDQIRSNDSWYKALKDPLPVTAQEIQKELPPDTLLLEYFLGDEHSYFWVVSTEDVNTFEVPSRAEMEALTRQFYQSLSQVNDVPDEVREHVSFGLATKLSTMLLKQSRFSLSGKKLLIVADGALHYLPFAALNQPGLSAASYTPLALECEITMLPSASSLPILSHLAETSRTPQPSIAVFADPVFTRDDERLRGSRRETPKRQHAPAVERNGNRLASGEELALRGLNLARLPFTHREAQSIAGVAGEKNAKLFLGFQANLPTVLAPEIANYKVLHFATHGILNDIHPELSGLVLSLVDSSGKIQNGLLKLTDISRLKWKADVAVLSACETGLGKEIKGEGLISLTRSFMYAGVPSVVVSLWNVDDSTTAELMARFYRYLLQDNLPVAAALRAAQMSILNEPSRKSPYYWAAFVLNGDWRPQLRPGSL